MNANRQRGIVLHQWLFTVSLALVSGLVVLLVVRRQAVSLSVLASIGYALAFFIARLLTIRLPQGDESAVTLMVGLVGLASLDIPLLLAASLIAGLVDALARATQSSHQRSLARVRDAIRGSAVLGLLAPWQLALRPAESIVGSDRILLLTLAAGITYAAVDVFTQGYEQSLSRGEVAIGGLTSLLRPLGTVYVVHIAMAGVALRLQTVASGWPFPIAILLTLILQNSFNLYMRVRRAYSETIGALAHAAELDRPQDSGHARRVSNLSVSVGRRIGLSSRELERIGYAALLHDIGRMGAVGEDSSGVHAERGAEIAASIPFLADVAPLMQWHSRGDGEAPPVGWKIVRTCSRYDRLRCELGTPLAMAQLRSEAEFGDQRVIEALDEIVNSGRHPGVQL